MSTYVIVTTVDADDPSDAIAVARHMDETTVGLAVDDRGRIGTALIQYGVEVRQAADFAERVEILKSYEGRLIEIVTLGNVPANT